MRRILWVDDDPLVLSSARRLLQIHGFDIHTIQNPEDVCSWLEKNEVSVVVADQRMPQMTGIELLKKIKVDYPSITRIMVTGFMEPSLVQLAINEADVFRFITKPWSEPELIADILQGIEHHKKVLEQEGLNLKIRKQKKELEVFLSNLELIISERTQALSQSKLEQESKNIKIKNLVRFIQNINEMTTPLQIIENLFEDLSKFFNLKKCFFAFTDMSGKEKIIFKFKKNWIEHSALKGWENKTEIRFFDELDKSYLVNETKLPIGSLISIPLARHSNDQRLPHTLFFEMPDSKEKLDEFVEFMTSRLQILSLGLEKILLQNKSKIESLRWEKTFDTISDPLCIVDSNSKILRKNKSFNKNIKKISKGWLEKNTHSIKVLDRIYNLYVYGMRDESNAPLQNYLLYFHDVTEDRDLYQKLVQGEKMAAIGLLAGNIAHELNNPLTGIRSMAQVLIGENSLEPEQISDLKEIEKACLRCHGIIQSLLDFSTHESSEYQTIKVQDVIHKTLPLLKTALRHHKSIIKAPEDPLCVVGDFKLLQQVLFNLIHNACQAMEENGAVSLVLSEKDKWVRIEVSDTGPGISKEILSGLFDPFVTTKKEGEGTGLGLSFSKSVINKMGGEISLLKTSPQGTQFEILLPRAQP